MTNDNTESDQVVKLHLQESKTMQQEWFTYALDAIQKLSDKIELTVLSIQKEREESLLRMVELRTKLTEQLASNDKQNGAEWGRINVKLDDTLKEITDRLYESETETNLLLKEYTKNYDDKMKEVSDAIQLTKDNQLIVSTKVKTYIAMTGIIIASVITSLAGGALVLFKDAIKAWIGN